MGIRRLICKIKNKEKLYNNDIVILFGFIISIFIIILYICNKYLYDKYEIFVVLLNLSFSYLAAFMFYIAQVKIPNKNKSKKALKILKPDIHYISEKLNFLVAFIDATFKINNDKLSIQGIDNKNIYIKHYRDNFITQEYINYRKYLRDVIKNIKNNINHLRNNDLYQYLPENFIDIISEFDMEDFSCFSSIADLFPNCMSYSGLENCTKKIKYYKEKINKFDDKVIIHKVELLDKKNKDEYKKELKIFNDSYQSEINNILKDHRIE